MRAKLTIFLLLFSALPILGQVGVQAHYENLTRTGENSAQFKGYTIGLDYWFRLDNIRLEFQPMLAYQQLNEVLDDTETSVYESAILELQTNFYPLDWFNDCKCPTFGKTNEFIKKGFFLTVAPFVGRNISSLSSKKDWMFGVKAGAGLDIGITQFLTITPMARLSLIPSHYLERLPSSETSNNAVFGYNLGVVVTFRFDEKNYAF